MSAITCASENHSPEAACRDLFWCDDCEKPFCFQCEGGADDEPEGIYLCDSCWVERPGVRLR